MQIFLGKENFCPAVMLPGWCRHFCSAGVPDTSDLDLPVPQPSAVCAICPGPQAAAGVGWGLCVLSIGTSVQPSRGVLETRRPAVSRGKERRSFPRLPPAPDPKVGSLTEYAYLHPGTSRLACLPPPPKGVRWMVADTDRSACKVTCFFSNASP